MIKKLYDLFQPNNYRLSLNIDCENLEFSGKVKITGTLTKKTNKVQLHAKDLFVKTATINGHETKVIKEENDVITLEHTDELTAGDIEAALEFTGKITEAMHGMYPCYFNHNGERKKLIATQFESHHAREAFPCIDEPAAKATFNLELITPDEQIVLSNTPIKSQSKESGRLITTFETTPVMSTYLLAWVFGEMVYKEAKTKDGVIVKNWASAAQDASWLEYSVKETVDLIEFYNDYFGVPYPLEKCDQVALPDFESGAMENWGLITYRETALLSDPKNPSLSTKQLISLVIAHELSHQWFGNLVTMQWWDDLWLNESFANMTEYLAVDRLHPEWQIWEEFIATDVLSATNRDVYEDVQAVRVAVNNPAEIHTLFDPSIVYAKGGKLLKMLRDLIGDDAWRKGLKHYFEAHAYKNTSRDDLWKSLESASSINVPGLMNTWIESPGQPLVTVSQKSKELHITQNRFLLDGEDKKTVWQIPTLNPELPELLIKKEEVLQLNSDDFVTINQSGVGHYIVNYQTPEQQKFLSTLLADPQFSSEWKITYLNGLVMLARHGDTTMANALETIKNASKEPRAAVWSQIAGILGSARLIVSDDEDLESIIKQFGFDLSSYYLGKLGWEYDENEPSNNTHLRTTVIGLSIASENATVIKQALEIYSAHEPESLPSELRSMLMGVAVRFGDPLEFQKLIELYKTSSNADLKSDISAALASTKKPEQAKVLMDLMLDTSVIRTQDTIRWYVYLLRNNYVREITWQWLKDNWDWIMQQFGGSKSYDDFARYSATLFSTDEQLKEYQAFFNPKASDPALKRAIKIGINEITAKSQWRKRDLESVTTWLKKYAKEFK